MGLEQRMRDVLAAIDADLTSIDGTGFLDVSKLKRTLLGARDLLSTIDRMTREAMAEQHAMDVAEAMEEANAIPHHELN